MIFEGAAFSLFLLVALIVLLIIPALRKLPGLGVFPTVIIIVLVVWQRGDGWISLGLLPPQSWVRTILMSVAFGTVIALSSTIFIEPLSERLTGAQLDLSALGPIRGNLTAALAWISAAWFVAATLEEIIFRGFMMRELARVLGTGFLANSLNIVTTSIVFGLAHWYQSRAGALSTGLISLLLGTLFIWNDFHLWLLILTHGVIDTVGILLIYVGWDNRLKDLFFKNEETANSPETP